MEPELMPVSGIRDMSPHPLYTDLMRVGLGGGSREENQGVVARVKCTLCGENNWNAARTVLSNHPPPVYSLEWCIV